jgi:drug/metabolite transporter (DMT)-like permease
MVTTSGSAWILPQTIPPRSTPFLGIRAFLTLAAGILLFCLVSHARRNGTQRPRRLALAGAFATLLLVVGLESAGCGGGAATVLPPPVVTVTPQGTSTITVTPSATSANGKPLQLQPIQLTLTVK